MAEAAEADAGPLGDVLEGPVATVAIQLVPLRGGRGVQRKVAGRGEVEVEMAVAVVVEHGHARAVARGIVLLRTVAADVGEVDPSMAGRPRGIGSVERPSDGRGRLRTLRPWRRGIGGRSPRRPRMAAMGADRSFVETALPLPAAGDREERQAQEYDRSDGLDG